MRFRFVDRSFLDDVGDGYSTRAAAAALCAAQVGTSRYLAYKDALFAQQPAEGSGGRSVAELIAVGDKVGLTAAGFASCVRTQAFADQVEQIEQSAGQDGASTVPRIIVDGRDVALATAAKIQQAIDGSR